MEVKLIPGEMNYSLPFNILDIAQPYDLKTDGELSNSNTLMIRYRFTDELQLQEIKNRLLATGRVIDIRITTNSR